MNFKNITHCLFLGLLVQAPDGYGFAIMSHRAAQQTLNSTGRGQRSDTRPRVVEYVPISPNTTYEA